MSPTARNEHRYRADIDGLRAIAILAVVLYHAGAPGLPGGFVGVDVFFVLSGYLITRLLAAEVERTGGIDLPAFYARRARRLLPAFVLVIATALVLGTLLLLPLDKELSRFARSVVASALFFANFNFARTGGGYFDGPTEMFPLLHIWSLAVEEQFYFLWPLLLLGASAFARRRGMSIRRVAVGTLAVLAIGSFATSVWASLGEGRVQQAGFYLLHSRAWQLALGALSALVGDRLQPSSRPMANAVAVIGIVAIAASVTLYDSTMAYPGVAALLPTLATLALLAAGGGAGGGSIVSHLLAARPMVAIGLVSYSWYLWHWPLLAFARAEALGNRDLRRDLVLVAVALLLAIVTYRWLENPIRRRRLAGDWSNRRVLAAAGISLLALAGAGLALDYRGKARLADPADPLAAVFQAASDINPRRAACNHGYPYGTLRPLERCSFPSPVGASPDQGGQGREGREREGLHVVVWGDSHGDHSVPLAEALGGERSWTTVQRTLNACPPLLGVTPVRGSTPNEACRRFNEDVLREIEGGRAERRLAVILAARWTIYQDRPPLALADRRLRQRLHDDPTHGPQASVRAMEAGLRRTLERLERLAIPALVIGPVPEHTYGPPRCLARRSGERCVMPRATLDAHRIDVVTALARAVHGRALARFVDPIHQLCDAAGCPAIRAGVVLYSDDDHLSASAARALAPSFAPSAEWLATTARGPNGPDR